MTSEKAEAEPENKNVEPVSVSMKIGDVKRIDQFDVELKLIKYEASEDEDDDEEPALAAICVSPRNRDFSLHHLVRKSGASSPVRWRKVHLSPDHNNVIEYSVTKIEDDGAVHFTIRKPS